MERARNRQTGQASNPQSLTGAPPFPKQPQKPGPGPGAISGNANFLLATFCFATFLCRRKSRPASSGSPGHPMRSATRLLARRKVSLPASAARYRDPVSFAASTSSPPPWPWRQDLQESSDLPALKLRGVQIMLCHTTLFRHPNLSVARDAAQRLPLLVVGASTPTNAALFITAKTHSL